VVDPVLIELDLTVHSLPRLSSLDQTGLSGLQNTVIFQSHCQSVTQAVTLSQCKRILQNRPMILNSGVFRSFNFIDGQVGLNYFVTEIIISEM
jgi:hypothetical protein